MKIELNTAAIIRGSNSSREKMIVNEIEIDKTVCYRKSHIPGRSAAIGTEARAELFSIDFLLRLCAAENNITNADIVVYFVKNGEYVETYENIQTFNIKDLKTHESEKFRKIRNNIQILNSRNCTITFEGLKNYKTHIIEYAERELKQKALSEPLDTLNNYLTNPNKSINTITNIEEDSLEDKVVETDVLDNNPLDEVALSIVDTEVLSTDVSSIYSNLQEILNEDNVFETDSIKKDSTFNLFNTTVDTNILDTNDIQEEIKVESTLCPYTDNIKSYKEQLVSIKDIDNTISINDKIYNEVNQPSEYLSFISQELISIKAQCDLYDEEILRIQSEIDKTILTEKSMVKDIEDLMKEISVLNTELSEITETIEKTLNPMKELNALVASNETLLSNKIESLNKLECELTNIESSNSKMINYLRRQIELATIEKYNLSNSGICIKVI